MPRWNRLAAIGSAPTPPAGGDKTGRGIVGLIGSGPDAAIGQDSGYATVGLVGKGTSQLAGVTGDAILLEDSSGVILLEDGTSSLLLE